MQVRDRVCVVTGGASGIGRALARRFAADGARAVVVVDRDAKGAEAVAGAVGGVGMQADVAREDDIRRVIDDVETRCGPIDLFCSNAGILLIGGPEVPNDDWQRIAAPARARSRSRRRSRRTLDRGPACDLP